MGKGALPKCPRHSHTNEIAELRKIKHAKHRLLQIESSLYLLQVHRGLLELALNSSAILLLVLMCVSMRLNNTFVKEPSVAE